MHLDYFSAFGSLFAGAGSGPQKTTAASNARAGGCSSIQTIRTNDRVERADFRNDGQGGEALTDRYRSF